MLTFQLPFLGDNLVQGEGCTARPSLSLECHLRPVFRILQQAQQGPTSFEIHAIRVTREQSCEAREIRG